MFIAFKPALSFVLCLLSSRWQPNLRFTSVIFQIAAAFIYCQITMHLVLIIMNVSYFQTSTFVCGVFYLAIIICIIINQMRHTNHHDADMIHHKCFNNDIFADRSCDNVNDLYYSPHNPEMLVELAKNFLNFTINALIVLVYKLKSLT